MQKEVQIVISAKDYASKTFKSLTNSAKKEFGKIKNSINRIGQAARELTVPATIASGAMVAAGNNFVKTAYKAETGGKLFNKMLKRVGENQSKVTNQVNQLAEALRIPSTVIEQNAKDLLRKGYSYKQIADIYKGAAASGLAAGRDTVDSIESVTDALVSEMSIALNRIGIAENLGTAHQNYAEQLGKTTKELTESEKAAAAHQMVLKATKSEVEDMPELFKGYGGAVADWRQELYQARVELGQELMPIWTNFYQKGADLLNMFNDLNKTQKETVMKVGKIASGTIAAAAGLGLMASAASVAGKAFGVLSAIYSIITSPIILGGAVFVGIGTALYDAWDNDWKGVRTRITNFIDESLKKWKEFNKWEGWNSIKNIALDIYDWFDGLWDKIKIGDWSGAWNQVLTGLKNIWKKINEYFFRTPKEAKKINNLIKMSGDPFKKVKPGLIYRLKKQLQEQWKKLSNWKGWGKIWDWVKQATNVSWQFIKNSWNRLKKWEGWSKLWNWIDEKTPKKLDLGIKKLVEGTNLGIKATLKWTGKTYNAIKKGFNTGNWADAIGIGADLWKKGMNLLIGFKVSQLAGAALLTKIQNAISWLGTGTTGAIFSTAGLLGIASVGVQLVEAANNAGKTWEKVGANIITAVALGMGIGSFTGNPKAGVLTFSIVMNLEVGEIIGLDSILGKYREIGEVAQNKSLSFLEKVNKIYDLISEITAGNSTWIPERPKTPKYWIPKNENAKEGKHQITPEELQKYWEKNKIKLPIFDESIFDEYQEGGMTADVSINQAAGIVHGGEWVMPAWMVNQFPSLTKLLENIRTKGFKSGGPVGYKTGGNVSFAGMNFDDVKGWIDNISNSINKFGKIISKVFNKLIDVLITVVDVVGSAFGKEDLGQKIRKSFINLKEWFDNLFKEDDKTNQIDTGKTKDNIDQKIINSSTSHLLTSWDKLILNLKTMWKKSNEKFNDVTDFIETKFENAQKWFQKPWEHKLDDIKNNFAQIAMRAGNIGSKVASNLGNKMINQSSIASGAIKGFQENGLTGVLTSLISNSKVFASIIKIINPIFRSLADIAGAVLLPVLKILKKPLEGLAKILRWVAKTIVKVWNGIVEVLDTIIFWDSLDHWKASLDDITNETDEAAEAMSNYNDVSGFKVAYRAYQVAT